MPLSYEWLNQGIVVLGDNRNRPNFKLEKIASLGTKKGIFFLKLYISNLSSTVMCNAKLVQEVAFSTYSKDESRNPKIVYVACHNLSQYDVM